MKAKHELRQSMLSERMKLSQVDRMKQSTQIANNLLHNESYINCKVLFVYVSIRDEISTELIINDALMHNKIVCVPKCIGKGIMEAYQIHSFEDLTESTYGISEPSLSCNKILPQNIDLCIIPALCCDLTGYRLGYGAGFYDRYLPGTNAVKIALCSADRVIKHIPIQEHDIKCNKIITEDGVFCCL